VGVLEIGIIFSVIFLFGMIGVQNSYALSCVIPINYTANFEFADVVFSGKVISKNLEQSVPNSDFKDSRVLFSINELFKGDNLEDITLITREWQWDPIFSEGFEYVVFAQKNDSAYRFQSCSPSGLLEQVDLKKIREYAQNYQSNSTILVKEPIADKNDQILPPIKQIKTGVLPEDVMCNEGKELIFKSSDGSPKCVSEVAAGKLVERGWATR